MATGSLFRRASSAFVVGVAAAVAVSSALVAFGLPTAAHLTPAATGGPPAREFPRVTAALSSAGSTGDSTTGRSIPVGAHPTSIVYDDEDEEVFVANGASLNLTVVSTVNDSSVASVPLAGQNWITSEAYDPASDYVYVAGFWVGLCSGCDGPWADAVNGTSHQIVKTNTSLERLDSPDSFDCLAYDPASNDVYACDHAGRVVVISAANDTIQGYIPVGSQPSAIAYDADSGFLYVANRGSNNVSVVNPSSDMVVKSIPVGSQPDAVLADLDNDELYVANNGSDNVSLITPWDNLVAQSVPVGCGPDALNYLPYDRTVFVADSCSDNLTGITEVSNQVVSSIPVGSGPDSVAYDASNNQIYVANQGSDNVTVLNATQVAWAATVTFVESGLPSGSEFEVSLGNHAQGFQVNSSTTGTVRFTESAGSYNYTVGSNTTYLPLHNTGIVVVSGANVSEPVTFRASAELWFWVNEWPPGPNFWEVFVANASLEFYSGVSTNGNVSLVRVFMYTSYAYTVTFPTNYSRWDTSGSVTVGAGPTNVSIPFVPLSTGTPIGVTPFPWIWVILGVAIAVVAVVVALIVRLRRRPAPVPPP